MQRDQKILADRFAGYFSKFKAQEFTCKNIERVFGGASRETYRVTLMEEGGEEIKLILRMIQDSGLIDTKQETEYEAYSLFQDSDVPVPKVIKMEQSKEHIGKPFIVMSELNGQAASPFDKEAYKPFQQEIGVQFWTILANITNFNISNISSDSSIAGVKGNKSWKKELDYWVSVIREDCIGAEPILEMAIRYLYKNYPKDSSKISLVHGDFRSGNFLFREEKITGILDWEMAHLGDPLEDLSWALSSIWCWEEKNRPAYLIEREVGIDIWKKNTGLSIDEESLFWWELFSCVKGLAIWISAGQEFQSGRNTDPINLFSAWIPGDIHSQAILDLLETRVPYL
tara:strand:+ start:18411 stop:19436 length:1026 start_codon:yes stop_codon:yes gene_type:complete